MKSTVNVVFSEYDRAADALAMLMMNGIKPSQCKVVGLDSDQLRDAIFPLYQRRLDRLVIALGALGLVAGAVAGFVSAPDLSAVSSAGMAKFMASFCGGTLGMLIGCYVGGILHLDNSPITDADIVEGSVTGGVMAVSIVAADAAEEGMIGQVLAETSIAS